MRYNKTTKKTFEKWCLHLHGACACMAHVCTSNSTCTHEDVHTNIDTKRSLPPPQQEAWKEETPNMHLGYKLGAVSITMYINSHTSF